ncbi:MAG: SDR family oxidoreductase [Chloroflexi bacterium]|jgi:NAD(P)-dependent dehydrogenase (short-subunit alcohol dehydrogenase family)|nr:SDR family oxidoreductase [Chloroflexota bacterium]
MGDRLKGRVAVISGSSMGIGRALAIDMAKEGADIVVNARNVDKCKEVVAEIEALGQKAVAVAADITVKEQAEGLINAAVENFGKIDILVNNAGFLKDRMLWKMSDEEFDDIMQVFLYGYFYCLRRAAILMREQGYGRIINMSSRVALGNVGQVNYGTAKTGILGMTRCAARDLGRKSITVNTIFPGAASRLTVTDEVLASRGKRDEKQINTTARIGDLMENPDTFAPFITWLCSEEAANVNGQTFFVRGRQVSKYSPAPIMESSIFAPNESWTIDEIAEIFPKTLGEGIVNPAPPQPPKE